MTLLDVYEQVKLVKPEVFPFYIEMKYLDKDVLDTSIFQCIFLASGPITDLAAFTYVDGGFGVYSTWVGNKIELLFLDEMLGHYIHPKDEHNRNFNSKFNRLLK